MTPIELYKAGKWAPKGPAKDICEKAERFALSPAQEKYLLHLYEESKIPEGTVPNDVISFRGEVMSVKDNGCLVKVMHESGPIKLWGKPEVEVEKGDVITVEEARVNQSKDDPAFGFFKFVTNVEVERPTPQEPKEEYPWKDQPVDEDLPF